MRTACRLVALLLGLAIAAGAGLAAVELVAGWTGASEVLMARDLWDQTLGDLSWTTVWLVWACVAAIAAGLLLLVLVLFPRRPLALPLRSDSPGRESAIDRRGLQERLRAAAEADADVASAVARVRRKAKVRAHMALAADEGRVRDRLRSTLRSDVDQVGLQRKLGLKVDVRRAKDGRT
ncbi:MAG: hypothetical protein KY434_05515 [Actinobacteria bacterium]|nr:hypothetical protein [Actinomycetota bacterium]